MEFIMINTNGRQPNKHLTRKQRQALFESLLKQSSDGKLKKGSISRIVDMFLVSTRTVIRLWNQAKQFVEESIEFDVSNKRTNIQSMAKALDMSKSTLHRRIKEGVIRPYTNAIKPYLVDANKRARSQFYILMIEQGTLTTNPLFIDMLNVVHLDEKIFLFVYKEPTRRNGKNQLVRTLETKPNFSVTKNVTRSCLIDKMLPAIGAKWPLSSERRIFIQQNNAKPHIHIDDEQFLQAASVDGFDFQLFFQPPNSPDLNVLDLEYSTAIQSIQSL
ncbi:uncharacterized protein LOC111290126 [Durio zibethinus]|uniref:Uncharacterized protein LOC111290126 n=1 Tax=Durio zibethinus TaxID=66656 RepID=A0A6P5YA10_DURZI|nr:uncharacterized protein LOC111290126 [Durio zibethinus]